MATNQMNLSTKISAGTVLACSCILAVLGLHNVYLTVVVALLPKDTAIWATLIGLRALGGLIQATLGVRGALKPTTRKVSLVVFSILAAVSICANLYTILTIARSGMIYIIVLFAMVLQLLALVSGIVLCLQKQEMLLPMVTYQQHATPVQNAPVQVRAPTVATAAISMVPAQQADVTTTAVPVAGVPAV